MSTTNATVWDRANKITEGDHVCIEIDDFDNTQFPKDDNSRAIDGEVTKVKTDIGHSAGEVVKTIAIGNPWDDGCYIDLGDTAKNNLIEHSGARKYSKVWRPRAGKDRILLGKLTWIETHNHTP